MSELRLAISFPTTGWNYSSFTVSLAGLIARMAGGIPTIPELTVFVSIECMESSVIHANREVLVDTVLKSPKRYTHLLFLDHDMVFEPHVIDYLVGRRHPVVATNYLIKRDPMELSDFTAVSLDGRRIVTHEQSTGMMEIAYTGFGVSLFELDVFRKVEQPWFLPEYVGISPECPLGYTTEDMPCFKRIRAAGIKCYLDQDASKLVYHDGHKRWSWRDWKRPEEVKNNADHQNSDVQHADNAHRLGGVDGRRGDVGNGRHLDGAEQHEPRTIPAR